MGQLLREQMRWRDADNVLFSMQAYAIRRKPVAFVGDWFIAR